jgi:hypothetical protein
MKKVETLDVKKVLKRFRVAEDSSPGHHKGSFKIEAPFEKALDRVLKVKSQAKKKSSKRASH